jgi:hypothetical protein
LFYASPYSWFSFESHLVCPWCPYIDVAAPNWVTWLYLGLTVGLGSGLPLALVGFCASYLITVARREKSAGFNSERTHHTSSGAD